MIKKKNILQLVEHLLPGGTERMAVNISNLLSESGYKVVLCTTRGLGVLEKNVNPNVRLVCLFKKHFLDFFAFFRLFSIVKRNNIQIIHAHSSSIYWAVLIKLLIPNIIIIWHDHYGFSEKLEDNDRKIIQLLSFHFDCIISVNEILYKWSLRNCKVRKDRIVQINNFPYLKNGYPQKKTKEFNIVLLGNLRPQKDHITFVKAIALIKYKVIEYKSKIIFAGLYWDDIYFQTIIKLIKEYDLQHQIEFRGSVENVFDFLKDANIGVLSSKSEGLPVSLLEYGLACLPVVVTNVGQCAEVVDYGFAGIVVPPSDPEAMAKALLDLIEHPEKRELLGNRLKERVENEYGANKFFREYHKLINCI